MLCSPAEGLPQCRLLETFSSVVTDMLSTHVSCMWQGFLSPPIERNPLLPWDEDAENDRMQGNITIVQWYLWLQIQLALHKRTILLAMGVSWHDRAFTPAGWNTWPCLLQKSQAPAQRFRQYRWWVTYWGILGPCLFYFINLTPWLTSTVLCPRGWLQTTGTCFHFHIKSKIRWTFTISNFIHTFLISEI